MEDQKAWTVLVWIAGDNNLDAYGLKDLDEMKRAASDDLNIVAQFDRAGDTHTRRYALRPGTALDTDVIEDVGETNTGDPAVAAAFFTWGMRRWPSDHVMAVIWNHGAGIDETDIYRRAVSREVAHRVGAGPHRRALFSTTAAAALTQRNIAFDDTSRDFLDNQELRRVLETVAADAGRTVDVLGFDACLMNMIEMAYELRDLAGYIVGSEQTEPGDGWPYDKVLGALRDRPDASPAEFAELAVEQYLASYKSSDEDVTQSAFDLARVDAAAQAVDALASALIGALDEDYAAISKAVKRAQRFEYKDFADLGDFCSILIAEGAGPAVATAARAVLEALTGTNGLVAAAGRQGRGVERATGASIYLPVVGDVSVAYDKLAFGTKTAWNRFLSAYRDA